MLLTGPCLLKACAPWQSSVISLTGQAKNLIEAVCNYFNVPFIEPSEESMRDLAIRGALLPQEKRSSIEDDIRGLSSIVGHLKPFTETAKNRGKYVLEAGLIENRGLPVDARDWQMGKDEGWSADEFS